MFSIRAKSVYRIAEALAVAIREVKNPLKVSRNGGLLLAREISGYSVIPCCGGKRRQLVPSETPQH